MSVQHVKTYSIVVNGRQKTVTSDELTYDQVVHLAFDNPATGPGVYFTITFQRGHGNKPEGTLAPGETVKVKDDMIFDVTQTDKS